MIPIREILKNEIEVVHNKAGKPRTYQIAKATNLKSNTVNAAMKCEGTIKNFCIVYDYLNSIKK